ncbi:MAG: radical SAM protein [Pseudomonadota bacterium]
MSLVVNEIFYSIQGESTHAGRPCVFVRLTGCNLRCSYCDTRYAYEDGREMKIDEIIDVVEGYGCPLIEITGGEPLLQAATPDIVSVLLKRGYEVLLETNGSQDISSVDNRCMKIVDFKAPSSGMSEMNDLENINRLSDGDEVKFVIGNRSDYEFARKFIKETGLEASARHPIHFSPVFGKQEPRTLAGWILDDRLNVRLQVQLHKLIGVP